MKAGPSIGVALVLNVDTLCAKLEIEHRLTKPRSPQTNGMPERFKERIADVLKIHRFREWRGSRADHHALRCALQYAVSSILARQSQPVHAMKDWHKSNPELFVKKPGNRPGCNT